MGITTNINISFLAVFIQGLLSFFSPCIFPLIPIYMGYLAGGLKTNEEFKKNQIKIFVNTFCFVIGISFAFFLLGFSFTAFGQFFSKYSDIITIFGGLIIILFGLYTLGILGFSSKLSQEKRLNLKIDKLALNPLTAILFGFSFSFAWTPCVGPILASVLLMTSSADTMIKGLMLIGVYTLGFVIPFLILGCFTGVVLNLFKKYHNIVKYTTKIGGIILLFMGFTMLLGVSDNMNKYLASIGSTSTEQIEVENNEDKVIDKNEEIIEDTEKGTTGDKKVFPAFDFTLMDQNGEYHTLSDYKGKVVFLNFWATWCGPCQSELGAIQELYEEYGCNEKDVIILGIANPSTQTKDNADIDVIEVGEFISNQGLTYPTLMDLTGEVLTKYGINAFPTTFMIDRDGNIYGYIAGALTKDMMIEIVEQVLNENK